MNNNYLLTLASSVIPILAIAFVGVMLLCKIYIKIRSKFNTTVNCWFCNQNARVPYLESNSWTCPQCEQYNGFTKDGDYNREIFQQRDCSNLSAGAEYSDHSSELYMRAPLPPRNGFCDGCNEAQRLKVEKLAQFEPKNESHFDAELKTHKQQLEEQYRLCSTCDRHLNKVLHEKKKMVLGSKFLAYIIKGAETLKQPHFNQIRFVRQQHWKQRLTTWTTLLIVINICCLISMLPALTSKSFINIFGASLGSQIFFAFSHILAFGKVAYAYLEKALSHPNILKLCLFLRTLMLMLLYSLGLKWPQIGNLNLSNLYTLACPFAMLSLAFAYNVVDSFKLTRFTFLLAVWSAFAGGIVNMDVLISKDFALLLVSFVTLILCSTCKNKITAKLHDNTANSFHKMYSEDYLSDDDTLSLLSQHFNCSSTSMRSSSSNHSYQATSPKRMQSLNSHLGKIPRTSSVLSLNNLPTRSQLSPTSSFKSFCIDDNQTLRPQYAASMYNFPINAMPRAPIFSSNQTRNCSDPLRSSVFGLNANALNGSFHNSTLSNTSFLQPNVFPLRSEQQQQSERFFTSNAYPPVSTSGRSTFANHSADISLASPFSVSSSAVHQQRSNNLLTPSRFSTTCLASNASASSWLSGGYFNQCNQTDTNKRGQYLLEHRNGLTTIDENLSRASSHSSGFESQNGRLNLSRENSLCLDSADLMQRTVCLDNLKGFQPIESSYGGGGKSTLSARPSLLSQKSHYSQPLTVNCSTAAISEHVKNDVWPRIPALRKGNGLGGGRDSFNLRKINEELPTIRRGDLLKKWKQGQPLS